MIESTCQAFMAVVVKARSECPRVVATLDGVPPLVN